MSGLQSLWAPSQQSNTNTTGQNNTQYTNQSNLWPSMQGLWQNEQHLQNAGPFNNYQLNGANNLQSAPGYLGTSFATNADVAANGIPINGPGGIQSYMSPYIQDVVNATQQQFNTQNSLANSQMNAQLAQNGALTGSQDSVAQANLARAQQTAQAPVIAGLYNQGYQTAANLAGQSANTRLAAAQGQVGATGMAGNLANQLYGVGQSMYMDPAQYNSMFSQSLYPYLQGAGMAGSGASQNWSNSSQYTQNNPSMMQAGMGLLGMMFANRGGRVPGRAWGGGVEGMGMPHSGGFPGAFDSNAHMLHKIGSALSTFRNHVNEGRRGIGTGIPPVHVAVPHPGLRFDKGGDVPTFPVGAWNEPSPIGTETMPTDWTPTVQAAPQATQSSQPTSFANALASGDVGNIVGSLGKLGAPAYNSLMTMGNQPQNQGASGRAQNAQTTSGQTQDRNNLLSRIASAVGLSAPANAATPAATMADGGRLHFDGSDGSSVPASPDDVMRAQAQANGTTPYVPPIPMPPYMRNGIPAMAPEAPQYAPWIPRTMQGSVVGNILSGLSGYPIPGTGDRLLAGGPDAARNMANYDIQRADLTMRQQQAERTAAEMMMKMQMYPFEYRRAAATTPVTEAQARLQLEDINRFGPTGEMLPGKGKASGVPSYQIPGAGAATTNPAQATAAGATAQVPPTDQERDQIIRMVRAEAGGEPLEGQQAVASVIMNRAQQSGMRPGAVLSAKDQFTGLGTPAYADPQFRPGTPEYDRIAQAVDPVLAGKRTTPATHYFSPTLQAQQGNKTPPWATQDTFAGKIGNHAFFNVGYHPQGQTPPATQAAANPGAGAPATPPPAAGAVSAPAAQGASNMAEAAGSGQSAIMTPSPRGAITPEQEQAMRLIDASRNQAFRRMMYDPEGGKAMLQQINEQVKSGQFYVPPGGGFPGGFVSLPFHGENAARDKALQDIAVKNIDEGAKKYAAIEDNAKNADVMQANVDAFRSAMDLWAKAGYRTGSWGNYLGEAQKLAARFGLTDSDAAAPYDLMRKIGMQLATRFASGTPGFSRITQSELQGFRESVASPNNVQKANDWILGMAERDVRYHREMSRLAHDYIDPKSNPGTQGYLDVGFDRLARAVGEHIYKQPIVEKPWVDRGAVPAAGAQGAQPASLTPAAKEPIGTMRQDPRGKFGWARKTEEGWDTHVPAPQPPGAQPMSPGELWGGAKETAKRAARALPSNAPFDIEEKP